MSWQRKALQDVRNKIEKGWCRYSEAKDYRGNEVYPSDKSAVRHCLLGAIISVSNKQLGKKRYLINKICKTMNKEPTRYNIEDFNDSKTTTKKVILQVIDAALAGKSLKVPEPS